jgi:hypothetical protein
LRRRVRKGLQASKEEGSDRLVVRNGKGRRERE